MSRGETESLVPQSPLRVRRARRRDFPAVAELCVRAGAGSLPEDRRTLRRFRHIVADLGADLYLAEDGERLRGLVYVVYARQLLGAPRAEVVELLVEADPRRQEWASALLRFALQRARKRFCGSVVFRATAAAQWLIEVLQGSGFVSCGSWYAADLDGGVSVTDSKRGETNGGIDESDRAIDG